MDAEGATRHPEAERFWHVSQNSGDMDRRARDGESWRTVAVFLSGGAPWGFTLRGGLEHREPLIITKVEEGSKAAAVSLQVGDELININEIPLSGYRQEAICLVKGSHKTLSLVVKRNLKMVDIVAQKMPSENDVHVARSFLTKILRSSMRRNEPISRPHSWHSTKFNESQSEAGRRQSPPTAVWHPRYDASSSSSATDLTSGWEQTNLRRVSDQFSSHGSMDSLEQVPHSYAGGQMSPAKSNNSMEHLGGGKRDSAYSSFSTSSSTPDYSLSRSNAASTENVAYKGGQWDAGAKHSNGRNSQSFAADGGRPDERLTYFQMPGVDSGHSGPHPGDSPGSRHSSSSRTSFGPVWNVPERKRTVSASPPPPLPPARSDSFAATKAHERGVKAHPDGPDSHLGYKVSAENRHSHNISPKSDGENDYDKGSHPTSSSNKQYSFYSSDVGQQHVPHASQLFHPRQHADKSTFHPQAWSVSAPKPQNAGGYHCSSQEPPTNGSTQHSSQNHRRSLSASLSSTTTNQNAETTGPSRYYCVTASNQPNASSWSDLPNDRRSGAGVDPSLTGPEQTVPKVKYQHHPSHNKDSNAYSKPQVTTVPESSELKHFVDDKESQRGHSAHMADHLHLGNLPRKQPEQRRSLPAQLNSHQDIRLSSQASNQFSPQTTPMLHSLSIDVEGQQEKSSGPTSEESLESKQVKRSERFATTLRNEIQMRRARLQKSRSAAALPGVEGQAEDQDSCISTKISTPTSADGSFSNAYKHDLKEAQARVLKATSFRRRDLERVVLEYSVGETQNNHQPSMQARKDVDPLATVTESGTNHSSGHVTRIGSRKRFPPEKKVRSYSEPNKLYEIGVNEGLAPTENATSSLDHQKNLNETMKPGFPDSMPPKSQLKYQGKDQASRITTEDTKKEIKSMKVSYPMPSSQHKQRLDTFAEYEASWKIQSKHPDEKASGRYRSADNILDPGPEDRTQRKGFHERSRSSPTADMYGQPHLQKIPVPETKRNTDYSQTKSKPAETLVAETRFSDTSSGDCKEGEKAAGIENDLAPPPPLMTGANPDCRQRSTAAATKNHKSVPISPSPTEPEEHSHIEPPSLPGKKPSPAKHQEINSQKSFTGSQSDVLTQCSTNFEPYPTFYPPASANTDSEQGKGLMDKEQGAVHHPSTSNPQLASSPPASSHRPSGLFSMEGQRSPSPQFSPQKLSDKPPPVSLSEDESSRVEHLIEKQNTAARKVPIRIVHSEGSEEKENSPFLQQSDLPPGEAEGQSVARFSALPALGQDSVFCAFTRQKEPEDTEMQRVAQGEPYMITVGDHLSSNSEEPSSQGETTGLSEQEDQKREELARDIMGKDKSLADILDQSKMRTTMDLMEGIFPQEQQLLDGAHQRRKAPTKQTNSRSVEEREKEDNMAAAMVTSSTYYSTSAPKAELLIKMKDMQEEDEEEDSEDELDIGLNNKKQELIDSLSKKLQVLREAKESLLEDILDNNMLGDEVEAQVQQVCRPNELEKFRMFVGDLDKVVSLLLSLSGRLARVENALNNLEGDATPEERRTLIEKRKLLIRQHEDAKELKENLDRRERIVFDILASYLPKDSLADYEHFVKMKSALIIEQRKLEDKIKLGEEQLKCLIDSLPIEQRLAL
ncbi:protein Shroom2 isoform X2 [Fundulus heteroclitus]|uniref:protein Shroom2 isoform X2 n=2 Tax=Fundulus heteroclitus TaxID=8078 RepID=UPI00165C3CEF|nr:protein Shroom2 isoform X2 [Fundulus heteroclitus]